MAEEPVELGQVEGKPRVRFVFADRIALMVAMGKHRTGDREAYRAQVVDLEAGAAAFVNFVGVALAKHLGDAEQGSA